MTNSREDAATATAQPDGQSQRPPRGEPGAGAGARPRGRPKAPEKRELILRSAAALFLTDGPEGTSMDAVARAAGVSKQTVYSHFGDKGSLFTACVNMKLLTYRLDDLPELAVLPVRDSLVELCTRLMNLLMDPDVVSMFRVVIGAAGRSHELGGLFHAAGPARTTAGIGSLLEAHRERGALRLDDVEEAAALLVDMLAGSHQRAMLLNVAPAPSDAAQRARVEMTVDRYLRLFGTGVEGADPDT